MEELTTILKARQFVRDLGVVSVPVDIAHFAAAANATIKVKSDLNDTESGQTFQYGGKNVIIVNGNHREERQRFTVLHEIAHIVLNLPSQHHAVHMSTSDLFSYCRRPKEEILCDVFAAECLLPSDHFKKDIEDIDVSLGVVKRLAERYKASLASTGSRFAVNCNVPCAFVLMEHGKIRYVSSSIHLRELNGWIDIGIAAPKGSVAHRLFGKTSFETEEYDDIEADIWFNNGIGNYDLVAEESILLSEWDQCLSLIWVDEQIRSIGNSHSHDMDDDDEPLLEELDGFLPWPSKQKKR